jgi:hypothetical protein
VRIKPDDAAPGPPWSSDSEWAEINAVLSDLIGRRRDALGRCRRLASHIAASLQEISRAMEALCRLTCLHCPDPCCLHAAVWLDFKDLVFLHLAGLPVPERQPICRYHEVCFFWHPRGCRLPRPSRPWICTWYLCPVQTARLRRRPLSETRRWIDRIRSIQSNRRKLEDLFLEALT